MSFRPEIKPYPVFDASTGQDMSGDLTSKVTIIQKLSMMSYSYSWAGTAPVGTISVEVSNDFEIYPDGSVKNAGTWNTLTFSYNGGTVSSFPVSGATGNGFVDIDQIGAYAIRTVYTFSSGVGTLNATLNAKVA